jgi:hypothetical protein
VCSTTMGSTGFGVCFGATVEAVVATRAISVVCAALAADVGVRLCSPLGDFPHPERVAAIAKKKAPTGNNVRRTRIIGKASLQFAISTAYHPGAIQFVQHQFPR